MTSRGASTLATCTALLALWAESALLAWWLDPSTSLAGVLAACAGGTVAAALVMIPSHKHRPWSWAPLDWCGLFFVGLAFSLAFVEVDCRGTLALVDGHPTCTQAHPDITQLLTFAVMALTTTALPAALRAWLSQRLARTRVR